MSDDKSVAEKVTDEVLQRLDTLARKMNTTMDKLWPRLVMEARAQAIANLAACVIMLVVTAVSLWICADYLAVGTACDPGIGFSKKHCSDVPLVVAVLTGAVALGTFIAAFQYHWWVSVLIAPEARALRLLLNALKK